MSDPTARNIVSQLGDLYMDFTHPATTSRDAFVKYRQATNDQADAFVERILAEVKAQALREAADDWQTGEWANVPRRANRVADRLGAAQHVSDWLRAEAERTERSGK